MASQLYDYLFYFLIYAFCGWVVEVIFQAVTTGKIINRGFLNGPVCPVYGFGVTAVLLLGQWVFPGGVENLSFPVIFLWGVLLATLIELVAGWALFALFEARWWDYSDMPLNFRGFICAKFSLIWGLAIVLVVRVVHPGITENIVEKIPVGVGTVVLVVLYTLLLVDLAVTVATVVGMNRQLKKLQEIRRSLRVVSDGLSRKIGSGALQTSQKVEEAQLQAALAKMELRDAVEERGASARAELQRQYEELKAGFWKHGQFGSRRILSAFPGLRHSRYAQLLSELKEELSRKNREKGA